MLKDILSPNPNTPSAMRLMSMCSLVAGASIAVIGLVLEVDPEKLAWLCAVFVGSAFGGKALQKKFEVKQESKKIEPSKEILS